MSLAKIEKLMRKDLEKFGKEKEQWAKEHGIHIFNLQDKQNACCLNCGLPLQEIKATTKMVDVVFQGIKLRGYPNCEGFGDLNRK